MSTRLSHATTLALLLLACFPGRAGAIAEEWARRYAGTGGEADEAVEIKTDPDGNAYVTGWSWGAGANRYDIVTVKYDPSGNEEWVRVYDRSGSWDQGKGIAVDDAGNAYVIGYSDGAQVTIKYTTDGDEEWAAVYPAGSLLSFNKNQDVEVDEGGNVYVCGHRYMQAGGQDILVLKYLPNGDLAWDRFHALALDDEAWNIAVAGGAVWVTGLSHLGGENFDIVTLKYDTAGFLQSVRTYDGIAHMRDISYALAVDATGVYVGGVSFVAGQGINAVTIKYDLLGTPAPIWVATYNGTGNDFDGIIDLAVDEQQNVYVAGQTANFPFPAVDFDFLVIKYEAGGNEAWVRKYDGPAPGSNDYAYEIEVDGAGDVVATGDEFEGPTPSDNDRNIITRKYDALGNLLWSMTYDGLGFSVDYGRSLALDQEGNVFVCGLADRDAANAEINYDYVTIKYSEPTTAIAAGTAPNSGGPIQAAPNPFRIWTTMPGRERERFELVDISGRHAGTFAGDRIGADLPAGVYFLVLPEKKESLLRIVKLR